jgi:maleamate amidohydrolase
MRQPLALPAGRVALLLVDLQEEHRHVPHYLVPDYDRVLANAARLLAAARGAGVPVLHAAYQRDFAKCPPRPLEWRQPDGSAGFSDKADPLTALCPEVAPRPDEPVILKNDNSAFCEGDLEPRLRALGSEWLAIGGVWTEACVAATVRDAIALGLRVLLVKDACGSGTAAMHQTAILNLANRLNGGAVADNATACRLLAGASAEAWVAGRPVPLLYDWADAERLYADL